MLSKSAQKRYNKIESFLMKDNFNGFTKDDLDWRTFESVYEGQTEEEEGQCREEEQAEEVPRQGEDARRPGLIHLFVAV